MDLSRLRPHPSIDLAGRTQPLAATCVRASRARRRENSWQAPNQISLLTRQFNCPETKSNLSRLLLTFSGVVVESLFLIWSDKKALVILYFFPWLLYSPAACNFLCYTRLEVHLTGIFQAYSLVLLCPLCFFRQLYLFKTSCRPIEYYFLIRDFWLSDFI